MFNNLTRTRHIAECRSDVADDKIYEIPPRLIDRAQTQDLQMMGMLLPLGIEKGKDFKPDVATVEQAPRGSGSCPKSGN
jgi:hypothetical protein